MTLRIATYNLRTGWAPDWPSLWWRRRRRLDATIADLGADLWALQEVQPMQRRYLQRRSLVGHRWEGSGRDERRSGEGLFVAARRGVVGIEEAEVRWFGPTPERPGSKLAGATHPRIVVLARIEVDGRRALVANVHLDHRSADRRRASLRQLVGWLEAEAGPTPKIVLGDVNARTGASELRPLLEAGLVAALGADQPGTFHAFHRRPPTQIDNLWCSPEVAVRVARVAVEAGTASDHDPVVAELDLP